MQLLKATPTCARSRIGLATILVGLCLALAPRVAGQVNTVTLTGTVSDPQGLAVIAATVTATSKSTNAVRSATSDSNGRYAIVGLPPGAYTLNVEASGF